MVVGVVLLVRCIQAAFPLLAAHSCTFTLICQRCSSRCRRRASMSRIPRVVPLRKSAGVAFAHTSWNPVNIFRGVAMISPRSTSELPFGTRSMSRQMGALHCSADCFPVVVARLLPASHSGYFHFLAGCLHLPRAGRQPDFHCFFLRNLEAPLGCSFRGLRLSSSRVSAGPKQACTLPSSGLMGFGDSTGMRLAMSLPFPDPSTILKPSLLGRKLTTIP